MCEVHCEFQASLQLNAFTIYMEGEKPGLHPNDVTIFASIYRRRRRHRDSGVNACACMCVKLSHRADNVCLWTYLVALIAEIEARCHGNAVDDITSGRVERSRKKPCSLASHSASDYLHSQSQKAFDCPEDVRSFIADRTLVAVPAPFQCPYVNYNITGGIVGEVRSTLAK